MVVEGGNQVVNSGDSLLGLLGGLFDVGCDWVFGLVCG